MDFVAGLKSITVGADMTNITDHLAQVYRYYRFTKLKFTFLPMATTNNNVVAVYVAGGGSSTTGAADNSAEAKYAICLTNTTQVPIVMSISREDLIQNQPWFITETDATDAYLDIVGFLHIEGNGTEYFMLKTELEYEFKFPMSTELGALPPRIKSREESRGVSNPRSCRVDHAVTRRRV